MVIYEITAIVESHLSATFEKYMRERHIPALIAARRFRRASLTRATENRYRIHYEAFDQRSLDDYLQNEAENLRADFLAHFPAGIELEREIWNILQVWEKTN